MRSVSLVCVRLRIAEAAAAASRLDAALMEDKHAGNDNSRQPPNPKTCWAVTTIFHVDVAFGESSHSHWTTHNRFIKHSTTPRCGHHHQKPWQPTTLNKVVSPPKKYLAADYLWGCRSGKSQTHLLTHTQNSAVMIQETMENQKISAMYWIAWDWKANVRIGRSKHNTGFAGRSSWMRAPWWIWRKEATGEKWRTISTTQSPELFWN